MSELLPCPFCGGEAVLDKVDEGADYRPWFWYTVHCSNRDCVCADLCHEYETEAEAIAAWNTRASYEADSYFFLPKPKESPYIVSEPTYFVDGHNVKATYGVSIMEDSVKRWQRQIEESMSRDVVGRICEVFGNTRAERTYEKVYAVGGIIAQAECKDVCSSLSEFTCSACGFNCDLTSWISLFDGDDGRHRHHHHGTPNYCPNCGRKVVDA